MIDDIFVFGESLDVVQRVVHEIGENYRNSGGYPGLPLVFGVDGLLEAISGVYGQKPETTLMPWHFPAGQTPHDGVVRNATVPRDIRDKPYADNFENIAFCVDVSGLRIRRDRPTYEAIVAALEPFSTMTDSEYAELIYRAMESPWPLNDTPQSIRETPGYVWVAGKRDDLPAAFGVPIVTASIDYIDYVATREMIEYFALWPRIHPTVFQIKTYPSSGKDDLCLKNIVSAGRARKIGDALIDAL